MARGSITKRGEKWRVRYWAPDGSQASKTFAKKGDAETWLTKQLAAVGDGSWVNPADGKVTFKEYAEQWLEQQPHRPSTARSARTRFAKHIYPAIGHRPMASIRTSEIRALVAAASKTLAPRTVEGVLVQVATVFKAAVEDRVVARTPVVRVTLPRPEGKQVVPMRPADVEAMGLAVPDRYHAAIVAAAGLGLRQGELFGLTVSRVDWLRRTVRVDRQLLGVNGTTPVFGPPKTEASTRTIPAPTHVLEALTAHLRAYGEGPGRVIFTDRFGKPVRRQRGATTWNAAADALGLEARGWHELRHFYASLLIDAGASVKVVQARLGHKSAVETLDTYGHLWPDNEDATRLAVDAVLGALWSSAGATGS